MLREASFPEGTHPRARRARVVRLVDRRLRLRRAQRGFLRADMPGAGTRRLRYPQLRLRTELAVHVPDLRLRHRGAETALAARDGAWPQDRLFRPHRVARRFGSFEHEDTGREEGRRL